MIGAIVTFKQGSAFAKKADAVTDETLNEASLNISNSNPSFIKIISS